MELKSVGLVQGDVNDARVAHLTPVPGLVLGDALSMEAHVWRGKGRTFERATLAATLLDADDWTVKVNFGTVGGWLPMDPTADRWNVEVQVNWPGNVELTFPTRTGQAFVDVRSSGDVTP